MLNNYIHPAFVKKWGWGKLNNDYKSHYIIYTRVGQLK